LWGGGQTMLSQGVRAWVRVCDLLDSMGDSVGESVRVCVGERMHARTRSRNERGGAQ